MLTQTPAEPDISPRPRLSSLRRRGGENVDSEIQCDFVDPLFPDLVSKRRTVFRRQTNRAG